LFGKLNNTAVAILIVICIMSLDQIKQLLEIPIDASQRSAIQGMLRQTINRISTRSIIFIDAIVVVVVVPFLPYLCSLLPQLWKNSY
jgi:hypothetical protein